MLVIAYHVLDRHQPYHELGPEYLLLRESTDAHLRRQLERLGNKVTLEPPSQPQPDPTRTFKSGSTVEMIRPGRVPTFSRGTPSRSTSKSSPIRSRRRSRAATTPSSSPSARLCSTARNARSASWATRVSIRSRSALTRQRHSGFSAGRQ